MTSITVTVSGTRSGGNERQVALLEAYLKSLLNSYDLVTVNHGCCVGVDHQAQLIARRLRDIVTVGWPAANVAHKWRCPHCLQDVHHRKAAENALVRNEQMVNISDELVALTKEGMEVRRSGTWATIRYARQLHMPIRLIHPELVVDEPGNPVEGRLWKTTR